MIDHWTLWADKPHLRRNLILEITNLPNKDFDVEIKPHKREKTSSQRNWFHKLMEIWGDEIGLTKGQCKEIVKGYHLGWRTVEIPGDIVFTAADGSSEDLDRIGYSALIETTYRLAAEMGVVLPVADHWKKQA